jgi:hypothetical protein
MDYEDIRGFRFEILDEPETLVLNRVKTVDGYIRKYAPPRNSTDKRSDIGLYMHSIRDANSLITRGFLTEKEDFTNNITIHFADLAKYAYLNCFRRYFRKDFRFGNLSPLIDSDRFETDETFRDLCVIDTIVNNPNVSAFDIDNPGNVLHSKGLLDTYRSKANKHHGIYGLFVDFCEGRPTDLKSRLAEYFTGYFEDLKARSLSHS